MRSEPTDARIEGSDALNFIPETVSVDVENVRFVIGALLFGC